MIRIYRKYIPYILFLFYLAGGRGLPALATTGYTITHIQVEGNVTIEEELLIGLSGLEPGVLLNPSSEEIGISIRKIAKYEGIKTVSLYLTAVDEVNKVATCVIRVEEHPKLASYVIEGISKKEKGSLCEQVKIPPHASLAPVFLRNTTTAIKKYFLDKGFGGVAVATELVPDKKTKNRVHLKIKIVKGKKSIVDKIIFEGNKHIDSNLLRYHITELNESPRFTLLKDIVKRAFSGDLFRKGTSVLQNANIYEKLKSYFFEHVSFFPSVFTEEKYLKAKKDIILFYKSNGFQDACITAAHCKQSPTGRVAIYFKIEEGNPYKIRHIKWVGNCRYSEQDLAKLLNLAQGSPYDPVRIKEQLGQNVDDLYFNNGYLCFRSEVIETGIEDQQVDLEIRIWEGKQATINQLHIVGNTITHDEVIRRSLYTIPGEKFNRQHVGESMRRLNMLQFFYPLSTPLVNPSETGDTVDITYVVKEKLNLNLSGGLSSADGLIGHVELGSNNVSIRNLFSGKIPLGAAQKLSFKGEFGKHKQKGLSLTFEDPWLWWGKRRYSFSFGISNRYQYFPYKKTPLDRYIDFALFPIGKQHKNGEMHTFSCWTSLGRQLAKDWSWELGVHYVRYAYQHCVWLKDGKRKSGISHDIQLNTSLSYDSTDNRYYPTRGLSWDNKLTITPPYTLLSGKAFDPSAMPRFQEFGKYMMDLSYFKKLPKSFVFHTSGHMGFLFSLSKGAIGPFHRFRMGGISPDEGGGLLNHDFVSLRGYPNDSLTPEHCHKQLSGGVLFQKVSVELRYPLALNLACVYLLGFMDVGDSWLTYEKYEKYNYQAMKKSIGLGLRVFPPIPIIPMIGIDIGYRLDATKKKPARAWEWHFHINPLSR
ncbi:BamA/OMP85 family outer membrane protein [Candidatus Cardinium hertigii]|nr:POTRA domain-containing protein [Candidatus Cardinium hertigii]